MDFTNREKELLLSNAPVLSRITLYGENGEVLQVFNENDYLVDWDYEDFRYVPDQGFIGQFVERLLDGHLMNVPEGISLEDKEISVEIAVVDPLLQTQLYHNYGRFIITKVEQEDTTGSYKFESSDYAKKFNVAFKGEEVTYPCTALELLNHACNQAGVKLNSGKNLFNIDNYSRAILKGSGNAVSLTKEDNRTLKAVNKISQTNNYCAIPLPNSDDLLGKTVTISCNALLNNVSKTKMILYFDNGTSVTTGIGNAHFITTNGNQVFTQTIPSEYPGSSSNSISLLLYASDVAQPINSYVTYKDIKIEEGLIATSYETYPQYAYCYAIPEDGLEAGNYNFKDGNTYYNFTISENLRLRDSLMLVGDNIVQRKVTNDYEVIETNIRCSISSSGIGTALEYNKVCYSDFTNNNFVIEDNQFEEQDSCRTVVTSIAKLSYTWARIDENNVLQLDFDKKTEVDIDSNNEIDTNKYYEATTTGDSVQPVNKVLIGMSNVEGENIVNETIADKINLNTMEGSAYQTSYNGYNYIKNGDFRNNNTSWSNWGSPVTREIIFDNVLQKKVAHIVSDTTRWEGYSQNDKTVRILPNTKYTISCKAKGDYLSFGVHWKANNTIVSQSWPAFNITSEWTTYKTTVTSPDDASIDNFNLMVGDNTTSEHECWFTDVQFEQGETAHDWEPFTNLSQSPNPYYEQLPTSISGGNNLSVTGKNLLDLTTNTDILGVSVNGDRDFVTINGISTGDGKIDVGNSSLKPGTYTIMAEYLGGTISNPYYITAWCYEKGTWSRPTSTNLGISTSLPRVSATFTIYEEKNICYGIYLASGRTFNDVKIRISIVSGTVEDYNYEPYQDPQNYEIDLGKNILDIDAVIPLMIKTMSNYSSDTLVYDKSTKTLTMKNANSDTYLPYVGANINYIPGINTKVEKHTTYTFHVDIDQPLSTMKNCIMGLNKATNKYEYITSLSTVNTITFNTGDYDTIIFRVGSTAAAGTITHFSNFQIERGMVATKFSPYFNWSKNLFKGDIVSGKYDNNTGDIVNDDSTVRNTTPIEIEPNTEYIFSSMAAGTQINVYEYDENMTFIGRLTGTAIPSSTSFTTSNNARYLNFSRNSSSNTVDWQVERGSLITCYENSDRHIVLSELSTYKDYIAQNTGANIFIPTLTNNGTNITQASSTVTLIDDEYTFVATGTDMYFGQVTSSGSAYANSKGTLYEIKDANVIYYKVTNPIFTKNYLTFYDKDKISLGYKELTSSSGSATIRSGAKYFTFRFGYNPAVSDVTYRTRAMISYSPIIDYEPYGKGDWYVKESVGKIVLNGNETGLRKSGNANNVSYYYSIGINNNRSKIKDADISIMGTTSQSTIYPAYYSYFKPLPGNEIFTDKVGAIFDYLSNTSTVEARFGFGLNSDITTIEAFKEWLSKNNVAIQFPLAYPIYHKITHKALIDQLNTIQKDAHTNNGTVYITSRGVEINSPLQITVTNIDGVGTSYSGTDMTITNGHEYEPSTITIYDNPLTHSEALRRIAINGSEKLFGFRYTPMEVNSIGHPWLNGNEFMKVTNLEEQDLYFYPFDRKMTYKGYLETTLSAQSKNEVAQKYENKNTIIDRVHHTEIDVDKANGQISLISTQTDENTSDISNLIVTTTGISTSVETIQNTTIPTITGDIDTINNNITNMNSEINDINNNQLTSIVSRLSQVEQTAEAITNMFQITGGINTIRNSAFLLSDAVWEFTNNGTNPYYTPLGSSYNVALSGSTTSVAEIKLRSIKVKSKSENITNLKIGTKYTFNFYHKQDNNMTTTIKMYSTENNSSKAFNDIVITGQQAFKNYEVSFTPTTYSNYTLEIIVTSTASVGYSYIYDLMLNAGDKQSWQPASDEIYSTTLTMSRLGLQVYSVGDGTITVLGSDGLASYETTDGRTRGRLVSQRTVDGDITRSNTTQSVYLTSDILNDSASKWIETIIILNGRPSKVEYLESGQ